jgi:hypothetical protein
MTIKNQTETGFIKVFDEWDRKRGRKIVYKKIFIGIDPETANITGMPPIDVPAGLTSIEVQPEDGVVTVMWTFECEPEVVDPYYELEGSVESLPITKHPKIFELAAKYARGLKDGEVDWYYYAPSQGGDNGLQSSSSLFNSGSSGSKKKVSPFYGLSQYYNGTAVFTHTAWYTTRGDIPGEVTSGVAKISNPTGLVGADYGQWLCIGARIQQVGDAFRVARSWQASAGATKWNSDLYG